MRDVLRWVLHWFGGPVLAGEIVCAGAVVTVITNTLDTVSLITGTADALSLVTSAVDALSLVTTPTDVVDLVTTGSHSILDCN